MTVEAIFEACQGGGGGQAVRVGVTVGGARIASATYAHVDGVAVTPGQTLAPGQAIGSVAGDLAYDESCWTGSHTHLEWVNTQDYACYYPVSGDLASGTPVGRVGGVQAAGPNGQCP